MLLEPTEITNPITKKLQVEKHGTQCKSKAYSSKSGNIAPLLKNRGGPINGALSFLGPTFWGKLASQSGNNNYVLPFLGPLLGPSFRKIVSTRVLLHENCISYRVGYLGIFGAHLWVNCWAHFLSQLHLKWHRKCSQKWTPQKMKALNWSIKF